jgi:hypothetical protein
MRFPFVSLGGLSTWLSPRRGRTPARRPWRPTLEILEGRETPSVLVGTGGDTHGDAVSAVAKVHTAGTTGDAHGDAVSAVAKTNTHTGTTSTTGKGDTHGDAVSAVAKVHTTHTSADPDAHGDAVSAVARVH